MPCASSARWRRAPQDRDPAEAYYRQALALADELGIRPLVAHCHLGLGRLRGQTGRGEEARSALTTAIALYRSMDMTFWLPQAEAWIKHLLKISLQCWACPKPLSVKSFHRIRPGNVREYLLKSNIGKASLYGWS